MAPAQSRPVYILLVRTLLSVTGGLSTNIYDVDHKAGAGTTVYVYVLAAGGELMPFAGKYMYDLI